MENRTLKKEEPIAESYISVDVETSGPIPGSFSLLSIGACLVRSAAAFVTAEAPQSTFYCTLKPIDGAGSDPAAIAVAGFSLEDLAQSGSSPEEAMASLEKWVLTVCGDTKPVFVGLNAAFDWSFINYYFHRFVGRNPFGFSALDIKSLYMGLMGSAWSETRSSLMAESLGIPHGKMSHHALEDAKVQAELFIAIRNRNKQA